MELDNSTNIIKFDDDDRESLGYPALKVPESVTFLDAKKWSDIALDRLVRISNIDVSIFPAGADRNTLLERLEKDPPRLRKIVNGLTDLIGPIVADEVEDFLRSQQD